ncbi:PadR family transcriptional regulator [Saccharibacillus sp. CPCC 101409]|uniref:PadR family transcriptional regulator n=1 Tax=Saccharibacillus sp. CPCC 101409 TaxID=3058041 RepID=UPI0026732554|nr:PadR family transcriptional regulator [Saccharibacillus sp. CPCC 101409]MDO3408935.1 PadR family transcriptional regulator [Saccharibacillus sp. CPCC 101409]
MYADILILGQLLTGPKHGYEIKKNVQEALGDTFELNNNALYPALRRFLAMGAMTKEIEKGDGKPDRHVYLLTETGEETFNELVRDFPEKAAVNQIEFLVRVALFERLNPEVQFDILRKRLAVLDEQMKRNLQYERLPAQDRFMAEVISFKKDQTEQEREWVRRLIGEIQAEEESTQKSGR